jgi:hypothetical protein
MLPLALALTLVIALPFVSLLLFHLLWLLLLLDFAPAVAQAPCLALTLAPAHILNAE